MHLEPALTLFRNAIHISRKAGHPKAGEDNSTPDTVRITIKGGGNSHSSNYPSTKNQCQMIAEVGFTTSTQDQPNANPEAAPLRPGRLADFVSGAKQMHFLV